MSASGAAHVHTRSLRVVTYNIHKGVQGPSGYCAKRHFDPIDFALVFNANQQAEGCSVHCCRLPFLPAVCRVERAIIPLHDAAALP